MSDEHVETQPQAEKRRSATTVFVIVAVLFVIAIGVALALALSRGDDGTEPAAGPPETTGTPQATQPNTQTPPGARPTAPVPGGSALATVTNPPENTLAMIDASRLNADARYTITFGVFGYGPPQGGQTLVIRISEAKADNESAQAMDMNGRNLLARVGPGAASVTVGGTYKGRLVFEAQGDLLIPVLEEIESAE